MCTGLVLESGCLLSPRGSPEMRENPAVQTSPQLQPAPAAAVQAAPDTEL